MYEVDKKYKNVEKFIHNVNGRVVDVHGKGIEIPKPVSPTNPKGGSRIIPAATQQDLEIMKKKGAPFIIWVEDKTPQYADDFKPSVNKEDRNKNKHFKNVDKL